jgi:1-acyl-sn-glycerol-3-phosphate acyltransferase
MAKMSGSHESVTDSRPALRRALDATNEVFLFIPVLGTLTFSLGMVSIGLSQVSQRAAFHCGTAWAWALCRTNGTEVVVRGRRRADPTKSYVIMSNHQSHFDILAIYGHVWRQFRWVMKKELRKIPILGWACEEIGHIYIDRSDREKAIASLKQAQERLEPGVSIIFFPEGSRSCDGRLGKFKKGGFVMALEMGLPILPITVSGANKVLPSKSVALRRGGRIDVTVHEPIDVSAYSMEDIERLMSDVREVIASGLTPEERG